LHGGGILYKRGGAWTPSYASPHEERISGMTVADLSRDGLLTITVTNKQASARLTPRGAWFARTTANDLARENKSASALHPIPDATITLSHVR